MLGENVTGKRQAETRLFDVIFFSFTLKSYILDLAERGSRRGACRECNRPNQHAESCDIQAEGMHSALIPGFTTQSKESFSPSQAVVVIACFLGPVHDV